MQPEFPKGTQRVRTFYLLPNFFGRIYAQTKTRFD